MKPNVTVHRINNETGKRTDKLELFIRKNGTIVHRHGITENTPENRDLFPVHRVFWNTIYYTQEIILISDELKQIMRSLGDSSLKKSTCFGWFKRLLCRIIAYSG